MSARKLLVVALAAVALIGLRGSVTLAQSSGVTIGVGDTVMIINGQTSPNAFVTIMDGNAVIGSLSADNDGLFTQTFPAQTPGLHTLKLYAQNAIDSEYTDTILLTVNLAEHFPTTVEVFLPPSIIMNTSESSVIQLSGYTAPGVTVAIVIDDSEYLTIAADANGFWQASVNTGTFGGGDHSLFVKAYAGGGEQSFATTKRTFSIPFPPGSPATPAPSKKRPLFGGGNTVAPPPPVVVTPGISPPTPQSGGILSFPSILFGKLINFLIEQWYWVLFMLIIFIILLYILGIMFNIGWFAYVHNRHKKNKQK